MRLYLESRYQADPYVNLLPLNVFHAAISFTYYLMPLITDISSFTYVRLTLKSTNNVMG